MEEIIEGLYNKEKATFEVAKHLDDYLIEKRKTEKNSNYIGKVDKFTRLEEASTLAEFLLNFG